MACSELLIPFRIKNDNCVASPCRAAALSAASRLVLFSNANWNKTLMGDGSGVSPKACEAMVKGAKLPGIFPMVVSLTYWPEPNATVTRFEHLSSGQNFTLSAQ